MAVEFAKPESIIEQLAVLGELLVLHHADIGFFLLGAGLEPLGGRGCCRCGGILGTDDRRGGRRAKRQNESRQCRPRSFGCIEHHNLIRLLKTDIGALETPRHSPVVLPVNCRRIEANT